MAKRSRGRPKYRTRIEPDNSDAVLFHDEFGPVYNKFAMRPTEPAFMSGADVRELSGHSVRDLTRLADALKPGGGTVLVPIGPLDPEYGRGSLASPIPDGAGDLVQSFKSAVRECRRARLVPVASPDGVGQGRRTRRWSRRRATGKDRQRHDHLLVLERIARLIYQRRMRDRRQNAQAAYDAGEVQTLAEGMKLQREDRPLPAEKAFVAQMLTDWLQGRPGRKIRRPSARTIVRYRLDLHPTHAAEVIDRIILDLLRQQRNRRPR